MRINGHMELAAIALGVVLGFLGTPFFSIGATATILFVSTILEYSDLGVRFGRVGALGARAGTLLLLAASSFAFACLSFLFGRGLWLITGG